MSPTMRPRSWLCDAGFQSGAVGAYGLGDLLDRLLTEKFEIKGQLVTDCIVYRTGNAHVPPFSEGLETRGFVYAIPVIEPACVFGSRLRTLTSLAADLIH